MALWQLISIGVALLAIGFVGGAYTMAYLQAKMHDEHMVLFDSYKASVICRAAERLNAGDFHVAQEWLEFHLDWQITNLGRHFQRHPKLVSKHERTLRAILDYRDKTPSRLAERGTPEALAMVEHLKESLQSLRQVLPTG